MWTSEVSAFLHVVVLDSILEGHVNKLQNRATLFLGWVYKVSPFPRGNLGELSDYMGVPFKAGANAHIRVDQALVGFVVDSDLRLLVSSFISEA